jgi:hypothetical protein
MPGGEVGRVADLGHIVGELADTKSGLMGEVERVGRLDEPVVIGG